MTRTHVTKRSLFGGTIAALAVVCLATATLAYFYGRSDAAISSLPASVPQVVVSKPLAREIDSRLGFLGQFSAIEHVELRAQVGGTLTGVHFRDGDIVHEGDLLFTIDARPYEIKLAQANAALETASARLALAERELLDRPARQVTRPGLAAVADADADGVEAIEHVELGDAQSRDARVHDRDHCPR